MAESVNGGNSSNPPKEMSMEVRLLLAFLLMGAVMFVTPYILQEPVSRAARHGDADRHAPQSDGAGSRNAGPGPGRRRLSRSRKLPGPPRP